MRKVDKRPTELSALIEAASEPEREEAWSIFLSVHSRLLLKVAHETSRVYDGAMDHYAFVLERLCADGYRRLRGYEPDGSTKFTTWLVVVTRRLCLDHHREVYGRPRATNGAGTAEHDTRRRLADFVMEELDTERSSGGNRHGAEARLRRKDLHERLDRALRTLPSDARLALRMRFEDEAPVADIAQVLAVPTVFHVYRRINKTLAHLRRELEKQGVDGPTP